MIMKPIVLLILMMILSSIPTFSQTQPPIENGVSHELAIWRAKHYSNVRYKLDLTLEKMSPLLKGKIEIHVTLDEEGAKSPLILDWRTTAYLSDKDKPYVDVYAVNSDTSATSDLAFSAGVLDEHLIISGRALTKGENTIKIRFASPIKTSGSAITRYIDKEDGSEYIYSLFVPSDASTAFPVFDQPDLKARFSLEVFTPKRWNVISNTKGESFINGYATRNGRKTDYSTQFPETQPISTYVFAFAAGDFSEIDGKGDGLSSPVLSTNGNEEGRGQAQPLQTKIYIRKSQAEKFKPHAQEVFRLNRLCIKYLEEYFDYKFPFPKYDLVLIPEFPFGGMEHAGATFLRESSIIFPSEPTKNDIISRANLIFHEAAHQWFGDTVTMKWFDDLWLKEGFAEFMAYKTLEKVMPEANAWKAFYERNKQLAYLTDSTKGTTPIYQEIQNLSSAKSAYGNIVYRKAPSFLRQAEFYLGEKEFQTAVRSFLKKNEFKNAEWTDLVKEFETATKRDLKDWASSWVTQPGVPYIVTSFTKFNEYCRFQGNHHGGKVWQMKIDVLFKFSDDSIWNEIGEFHPLGKITIDCIDIKEKFAKNPLYVFPNYQDYGYGIFLLDEKSRNYILANVQNEKDDFLRSMMYGSLWDSVREAELDPKDFVELAIKNVGTEQDEMIVSAILNRVNTAFAYYLDDKTRNELSPKLEEVLINKMQTAETQSQKNTFYRAFLNVASSEKGKEVLKEILKGGNATVKEREDSPSATHSLTVAFPPIKTKDKFDIVTKLLILGDKDAEKLLAELVKTETSDDAKRYAYAAKAGIATDENKAKYFNDFVANKEISESWIESAFISFNSVKHSELTLPYLEKALLELPNLKRSRKIFFVNGWLSAFIGGQKSEKALESVNKFLADNSQLDKDLRLKILENVDVIERAVKIRKRK
jgi:aminopeptidase N